MKIESQVLRAHPFLSLIPRFTLRRLLAKAPMDEYPKGSVVFRQGDPCDAVYLIFSGRCAARQAAGPTSEAVEEIMGPGDTLGDRELLHGEPYRSTVTVATDSVLVRFGAEELRRIFKRNPAIAGRVSASIAGRVKALRADRERSSANVRRIATVLSLSPEIDDDVLVEDLASELAALGGDSVLLVRMLPGYDAVAEADPVAAAFNGTFHFADRIVEREGGYSELRLRISGDAREAARMAPLLGHFGMHFDHVLIHVAVGVPVGPTLECLIQSDFTFLLLTPDTERLYDSRLLFRQVAAQAGSAGVRIRPILCMDGEASGDRDFERAMRESGHPVHAWLPDFPRVEGTGGGDRYRYRFRLRSLAREIAGCRVGLALSSGGAKGFAHIGVIQTLEEHGVEIDMVAGASMGAYVGAVWASGHDGIECERIARSVPEGRWGILSLIQPELPPRRGFLRTGRVARRLRRSLGNTPFSGLHVPLKVVATYLDTLERVVFSTGDVVRAVEASIAIPGVCVPVRRGGETFVDGGIVDPLPVDVLQEAGIDRIIAVNTIPTPETLGHCLRIQRETPSPESRVGGFLNRHLNYFASGNVLDTMLRSISGAQTQIAEAACTEADIVLRPIACDARWHDFANPGRYIALGRKVTEDRIEEILALAPKRLEARHAAEIAA